VFNLLCMGVLTVELESNQDRDRLFLDCRVVMSFLKLSRFSQLSKSHFFKPSRLIIKIEAMSRIEILGD